MALDGIGLKLLFPLSQLRHIFFHSNFKRNAIAVVMLNKSEAVGRSDLGRRAGGRGSWPLSNCAVTARSSGVTHCESAASAEMTRIQLILALQSECEKKREMIKGQQLLLERKRRWGNVGGALAKKHVPHKTKETYFIAG